MLFRARHLLCLHQPDQKWSIRQYYTVSDSVVLEYLFGWKFATARLTAIKPPTTFQATNSLPRKSLSRPYRLSPSDRDLTCISPIRALTFSETYIIQRKAFASLGAKASLSPDAIGAPQTPSFLASTNSHHGLTGLTREHSELGQPPWKTVATFACSPRDLLYRKGLCRVLCLIRNLALLPHALRRRAIPRMVKTFSIS